MMTDEQVLKDSRFDENEKMEKKIMENVTVCHQLWKSTILKRE